MTTFGGPASQMPRDDSTLTRRLDDLERQLREMRAARSAEQTSIASGATHLRDDSDTDDLVVLGTDPTSGERGVVLRSGGRLVIHDNASVQVLDGGTIVVADRGNIAVFDHDGREIVQLGGIGANPTDTDVGLVLFRPGPDTYPALTYLDGNLRIIDASGNIVLVPDGNSTHGLARPRLSMGQWVDYTSYPTATTTSTSWAKLQVLQGIEQQPRVKCDFYVRASDSTTSGQVRLTCGDAGSGGFVVGDPFEVGAGDYRLATIGAVALSGFQWQRDQQWFLEAQVVSGSTGTIGVRGLGLWGDGS